MALLAGSADRGASCRAGGITPSAQQRAAAAALVTLAFRHAVRRESVTAILSLGEVRIVDATAAYSEPASFIVRGTLKPKLMGIWVDRGGSRREAYEWARRKVGLPEDAARCFAMRSTKPG